MGSGLGTHMVRLRFRFVVEDVDRHGNVRTYFRRKGRPKVRLPGLPGSSEFMEAYRAALESTNDDRPRQFNRVVRGSFRYVCTAYFGSATFKALDKSTQSTRRRALEAIAEVY